MYAAYDHLAKAQPHPERRRGGRIAWPALRSDLGRIIDLSVSGIRIRLGWFKRIKSGQPVELTLQGHDGGIRCRARVVRHLARQVALELLDLDDAARSMLGRLAGVRAECGEANRRPRMD